MKVVDGQSWMISCSDRFDASVAFFRDVMGLRIEAAGRSAADTHFQRYAQFRLPNGSVLEVVEPVSGSTASFVGPVMCIPVDDLLVARRELEVQGTEVVSPIFRAEDGTGWFYFRAPDGHVYQLFGPCS